MPQLTSYLQCDTLLHQIVLHLNPHDSRDRTTSKLVDEVRDLTDRGDPLNQVSGRLEQLEDVSGRLSAEAMVPGQDRIH